jgi:hypothetical protein
MIWVTSTDFRAGAGCGHSRRDCPADRCVLGEHRLSDQPEMAGRVRRVRLVAGVVRVLRLGFVEDAVGLLHESKAGCPVLVRELGHRHARWQRRRPSWR